MADREDSADVDGLFRLPLHEFTEARNALASRLQKAGRKDEAAQVRTTPKPPLSAWVVNQLFWRERGWFDKLLEAAARLRQGHVDGSQPGQPANIQGPLKEQREALNQLSRKAALFLSETGHNANPDVLRRVTQVLQGVAAREGTPDAPRPGRLTSEVPAPGFEVLSGMLARAAAQGRDGGSATRVLAFTSGGKSAAKQAPLSQTAKAARERARLAAARRAVQEAERTVDRARKAARKAEVEMKDGASRVKEAERERLKVEAAMEAAKATAERARLDARQTANRAAEAAQELDDAERELTRARAQLED